MSECDKNGMLSLCDHLSNNQCMCACVSVWVYALHSFSRNVWYGLWWWYRHNKSGRFISKRVNPWMPSCGPEAMYVPTAAVAAEAFVQWRMWTDRRKFPWMSLTARGEAGGSSQTHFLLPYPGHSYARWKPCRHTQYLTTYTSNLQEKNILGVYFSRSKVSIWSSNMAK